VPRVIITAGAANGFERCRRFLAAKAPHASRRAADVIARKFLLLETIPLLGRPVQEQPELREIVIEFGDSGYVLLCRHEEADDAVYLLAFRHQTEAGY
jgi:plasmid stabilization system protein ParE